MNEENDEGIGVEINKSLQEINQSIIGTGETILDLNKTLTRIEDLIKVISQNTR